MLEYDPIWAEQFQGLRVAYADAMQTAGVPVAAIEHVGSTALPGLAAKPVIDCDIVVDEGDVARASDVLRGLGFMPLGELGIPQRYASRPLPGCRRRTRTSSYGTPCRCGTT